MDNPNKKAVFLYEGPHRAHVMWAESIGAKFIRNKFLVHTGEKSKDSAEVEQKKSTLKELVSKSLGIPFATLIWETIQAFSILGEIEKNTQILLCEGRLELVTGFLFKKLRRKRSIIILADPLVYEMRTFSKFWKNIYTYLYDSYDLLIAVSPYMKDLLPEKLKKHTVVMRPPMKISGEMSADAKSKKICYLGTIDTRKGLDIAKEVFIKVKKKIPECEFIIVGLGPLSEELAKVDGIKVRGFVPDPKKELAGCAVYLHLARFDPAPVTVIETMYLGIVPVVSNQTGNLDLAQMVDPGLVVDINDTNGIASIVIKLLCDEKKLEEYMHRSRKVIEELLRENALSPSLGDLINKLDK